MPFETRELEFIGGCTCTVDCVEEEVRIMFMAIYFILSIIAGSEFSNLLLPSDLVAGRDLQLWINVQVAQVGAAYNKSEIIVV